jgi:hypothetical protein
MHLTWTGVHGHEVARVQTQWGPAGSAASLSDGGIVFNSALRAYAAYNSAFQPSALHCSAASYEVI